MIQESYISRKLNNTLLLFFPSISTQIYVIDGNFMGIEEPTKINVIEITFDHIPPHISLNKIEIIRHI